MPEVRVGRETEQGDVMHHRVALDRVLRVQPAMDAVSLPDTSSFDLVYLDALVRRFAAEQGYPPALWEVRESRSLSDWEGQREVLVPRREELTARLQHCAAHVPVEATSGRAWADRLPGGLALLSLRVPGAIPDPVAFLDSAVKRYREEVSTWQARPDPPEEGRSLISLSRSSDEPARAEVHSDPVTAVLDFLHQDRPGHRVQVQLHDDGMPARPLKVADLWLQAFRSSTLRSWYLVDSYRLQWLRHRLAGEAPTVHYGEDSTVRDRRAAAAVDWSLTFGTSLSGADVVGALEQDAGPHDNPAWQVLDEYQPVRAGEVWAEPAAHRREASFHSTTDWPRDRAPRSKESLADSDRHLRATGGPGSIGCWSRTS